MPGLCLLIAVMIGGAEARANQALPDQAPPSRTILFVADGAGVAHWSAARLKGDSLAVAGFPVVGLVDPGNTTGSHVESASSATAFAIGERTFYGAIGVGPDQEPRPTVLEVAEEGGLATGLVTTTYLLDATPSAFAAHVSSRSQWARIAREMLDQDIEVLMGDGLAWFDSLPIRERYTVVTTPEELRGVDVDQVSRLLGLFDIDGVADPELRAPSLAEMTGIALAILDRDSDGFFLLVENEHTDHRAHDNAPLAAIQAEVADIDRAIRAALDYRAQHPETLIVVTGDHETGGLAVVPDSTGALEAEYVTTGHSLELVPLFAIGPGAEAFAGIRTNAAVGRLLLERVGGELSAAVVAPSPSSQ
ncbi:MAG: alkaline phosphatase [Gemmatimonadota bacterium]